MSFSAEMKDFLGAYSSGQKINASRTDQDYKESLTDAMKKKTEYENSPEYRAAADEQEAATLAHTRASTAATLAASGRGAAADSRAKELHAETMRQLRGGGNGSGMLPPTGAVGPSGPIAPGQGALPLNTDVTGDDVPATPADPQPVTREFADGGLVEDDDAMREHGKRKLKQVMDANATTREGDHEWWARKYRGDQMTAAQDRAAHTEDDLQADRTGKSREGNARLVTGFADGGLVDETPDDVEPQSIGGVPINPINQDERLPTPADAPTDVSARRRGLHGVVSPALVNDAVKAGATYGAKEYGLMQTGAVQSPAQQIKARAFAQGHGALTPEEMEAAKKAVDPEGKLSEAQRNAAALGSVYQYWANKGDGDKAGKVAFQMLQSYRVASQRYAAIAAHAAQGGNVDMATKAAMKAYANVPDGNDMEMLPNPDGGIMYAMTGPNGDVITKGIATPQQLYAQASGLAQGGFDKALMTAAGQAEAAPAVPAGKAGAGKTQTATDRLAEDKLAGGEIDKLKEDDAKKNAKTPDKIRNDEYWNEAHNTAQHIMQQNHDITASEAARAAHLMLTPPDDDPEKKGAFKVVASDNGGPSRVKMGKLSFDISDDKLDGILNSRAERIKQRVDDINKKMEESDKPGVGEKISDAAGNIGGAVANVARDAGGAVGAVGDIAKRVGGSLVDTSPERQKADEAARAQAEWLASKTRNPGAIPIDDGDRPL